MQSLLLLLLQRSRVANARSAVQKSWHLQMQKVNKIAKKKINKFTKRDKRKKILKMACAECCGMRQCNKWIIEAKSAVSDALFCCNYTHTYVYKYLCVYAIAISLLHTYCENENHCSCTCLPQTNKVDVASYTLVLMKKLSLCGTQKKKCVRVFYNYFCLILWFLFNNFRCNFSNGKD